MNSKRNVIVAAILMLLVSGLALAQTSVTVDVKATSFANGTAASGARGGGMTYGYTFSGRTYGALPGSVFFSVNTFGSNIAAEVDTELRGGTWALPIYADDPYMVQPAYRGTLRGIVKKGVIRWPDGETLIELDITGGADGWDGVTGYGSFEGKMNKTFSGQSALEGKLTLVYKRSTITLDGADRLPR